MGLKIRKSKNFGPVRVNLSKSGIGWSIGTKGARYTKRADGKTQTSFSIPGTGISYVDVHGKNKSNNSTSNGINDNLHVKNSEPNKKKSDKPFYKKMWFMSLMFLLLLFVGCNSSSSQPTTNSRTETVQTSKADTAKNDTSEVPTKQEEVKLTGWQKTGSKYYFYDSNGVKKTGWIQDKGNSYYLSSTGEMQTGWVKDNNKYYYLNSDGTMKTGWLQENGNWYYLNTDGTMATGIKKDGYSIDSNGVATKIVVQSSQSSTSSNSSNSNGSTKATSSGNSIGTTNVSSRTVYVSNKGIYHNSPTAHGMKYYTTMSVDEARNNGYRACESKSCS